MRTECQTLGSEGRKSSTDLLFDSRLMHRVFDSPPASAGLPHLQGRPVERCHEARDTVDASCSQSFSEFSVDSVAWFSPHVQYVLCEQIDLQCTNR